MILDVSPSDLVAVAGVNTSFSQALKTAAKVRGQALTGFDGLIHLFSDVELFSGTFPKDQNIKIASLELTVSAFLAIEEAIQFFTTNSCKSTQVIQQDFH